MSILIKNGRVIDPDTKLDSVCDILVENGITSERKENGVNVTAEVCPHHFSLISEDIKGDDANYKMNPPLRERRDIVALIRGLEEEIIDVISTDHAPHSMEGKKLGIERAPFGITGLETAAALTMTNLVKKGFLIPMQMAERMSYAPAEILNIDKGKNTPFSGMEVYGKVEATIVGGMMIYDGEEIINYKEEE